MVPTHFLVHCGTVYRECLASLSAWFQEKWAWSQKHDSFEEVSIWNRNSLIKCEKLNKRRGRPPFNEISLPSPSRRKIRSDPPSDVRKDGFHHYPVFTSRGKCALCKVGFTETCCCKCGVRLCIKKHSNCFFDYRWNFSFWYAYSVHMRIWVDRFCIDENVFCSHSTPIIYIYCQSFAVSWVNSF